MAVFPAFTAGGDVWASLDGRANAAPGSAQYPTLLNSYTPSGSRTRTGKSIAATLAQTNYQPPWMVAGVDYAVGVPSNVTLKTTFEADITGGGPLDGLLGYNPANGQIRVIAPNVTLDGYDLTVLDPWDGLIGDDGTSHNFTVQNCRFGASPGIGGYINWFNNGITIKNCEFYGDHQSATITIHSSGSFSCSGTVMYNRLSSAYQHPLEVGNGGAGAISSLVYKYNLIEDYGTDPGGQSHLNYLQFGSSPASNIAAEFNTVLQHVEPCGGNGFQFFGSGGDNVTFTNASMQYNTLISVGNPVTPGPTQVKAITYFLQMTNDAAKWNNSTIANNYADLRGAYATQGTQGSGDGKFIQPTNTIVSNPAISLIDGTTYAN